MIDKIDRPDTPPSYQITRPKDAKEDQHRPPSQREEQERKYQKELTEKAQEKFGSRTVTVKSIRVSRESIIKCLFRAVTLSKGVGILQIDVLWKDGRSTKGALVAVGDMRQFIELKKFAAGQEVPEEFWMRGNAVELGIIKTVAAPPPKENGYEATSVTKRESYKIKINWKMAAVFAAITIVALMIIILVVRRA